MEQRALFVGAVKAGKASFVSVCRSFDISEKTGYKWLARFEDNGVAGLEDRSRRPHSNSRALSNQVAQRFIRLRKKHPTAGPRMLVQMMKLAGETDLPAPSTIGEMFKRHGLVKSRPEKQRARGAPKTAPLSHATCPNRVWAMDFKGWFYVGDGSRCDPFTVTDAYSRFLLCCDAHELQFAEPVWKSLVRTFREHGLPDSIRVDNGQPWVAPKGDLGLTQLAVWLLKLGIRIERIDAGKPYQNGRHERFHLTLLRDTINPPAPTIGGQHRRFQRYRAFYNLKRPHQALGDVPPATMYEPSRRRFPSKMPSPEYPRYCEVLRVNAGGAVAHRGVPYFISTALRGERIAVEPVDDGCFAVYFTTHLLGHIHAAHPELGLLVPQRSK